MSKNLELCGPRYEAIVFTTPTSTVVRYITVFVSERYSQQPPPEDLKNSTFIPHNFFGNNLTPRSIRP